MTGGAFGSMIAQLFHLTSAERKTLLVAGAAAGMSATFAAPVAAVLLAVELLLFEWKPRSLIPVALGERDGRGGAPVHPRVRAAVSCARASIVHRTQRACWAASWLGLLAGAFFRRCSRCRYMRPRMPFKQLQIHWMWWPAIGGWRLAWAA